MRQGDAGEGGLAERAICVVEHTGMQDLSRDPLGEGPRARWGCRRPAPIRRHARALSIGKFNPPQALFRCKAPSVWAHFLRSRARMGTTYLHEERLGFQRRHARAALRVIIADDDRDTVTTLKAILEDEGHSVHPVYSGQDVLPTARIVRPDAIILDISVPGMSGYAVAQAIRHTFTQARRPLLVAISGKWKGAADRLVAQQVGFDHHLLKPCDPAALLELLEKLKRADGPG